MAKTISTLTRYRAEGFADGLAGNPFCTSHLGLEENREAYSAGYEAGVKVAMKPEHVDAKRLAAQIRGSYDVAQYYNGKFHICRLVDYRLHGVPTIPDYVTNWAYDSREAALEALDHAASVVAAEYVA